MRRYAKLLTAVLMLVAMMGAAVAELWEDAFRGDAAAQMKLGDIYANGHVVPQDYGEAARWYRLAADQGYAAAQIALGLVYYIGLGVPKDHKEAARWYRLAAEQGDAKAQRRLGDMYFNGEGVPQDYGEAAKWHLLPTDWADYLLEESAPKSRYRMKPEQKQRIAPGDYWPAPPSPGCRDCR